MAYEQREGEGTLWPVNSDHSKAPDYKGGFILPDGSVIGLAVWVKESNGKRFLSVSVDDREGEYQAKQMRREQTRGSEKRSDDRRDSREDRPRDRSNSGRSESRYGSNERRDERGGRDARRDDRGGSRHQQSGRGSRHDDARDRDLDDEIPF